MWYRAGKQVLSNQTWPEEDLENDLKRHEEDLEGPHGKKANLRTTEVMKTQVLRVSLGGRAVFPQPGLRIDRTASNGWQNDQNDINFLNFWTRRLNHVHQLFNFINISTRTCLVLSPITLAATGRYRCEVLGDRSYCWQISNYIFHIVDKYLIIFFI